MKIRVDWERNLGRRADGTANDKKKGGDSIFVGSRPMLELIKIKFPINVSVVRLPTGHANYPTFSPALALFPKSDWAH